MTAIGEELQKKAIVKKKNIKNEGLGQFPVPYVRNLEVSILS